MTTLDQKASCLDTCLCYLTPAERQVLLAYIPKYNVTNTTAAAVTAVTTVGGTATTSSATVGIATTAAPVSAVSVTTKTTVINSTATS